MSGDAAGQHEKRSKSLSYRHFHKMRTPVFAALTAVVLVACGGGSDTSPPTETKPSSPSTPATPATPTPPAPVVSSVSIAGASTPLYIGGRVQLAASAFDASGAPIAGKTAAWQTSDPNVLAVGADGVVAGVAFGAATVTATVDGKSASVPLSVKYTPVASVRVTPGTFGTLQIGDTIRVFSSALDSAGQPTVPTVVTTQSSSLALQSLGGGYFLANGPSSSPITITITADGKSGSTTVAGIRAGWHFSSGVDPASLVKSTFAYLDAESTFPGATLYPGSLYVRCRANVFEVYVGTGTRITANGTVFYRFGKAQSETTATWNESTDFKALFVPGGQQAAKDFALRVVSSDTLFFANTEFGGTRRQMLFVLTGLGKYLPSVLTACL
jgi:hypothetical protein